ncbi:MAG TPA: hypothetical protein VHG32_18845 [Thermoanaerobaculia bacterium]|nr:hypothetical protein [Thermoanaerobaculia bacterium]
MHTNVPQLQLGEIKSVGKSGQISLGKRYAGKTFCVQQRPDGSLLLTAVAMVPESQLWTLREPDRSAIIKGMTWAASVPPSETDLDALAAKASRPRGSGASRRSRAAAAK